MIEFEKKLLLNEKQYTLLKDIYKDSSLVVIVNHYYDTDNYDMLAHNITCRIRDINGIFFAEIKQHNKDWLDCSIENCCAKSDVFDDSIFRHMNLKHQGCARTDRLELSLSKIKIALDKITYHNTTEYELEIEYDIASENEALYEIKRIANEFLSSGLISADDLVLLSNCQESKAERFFRHKKELETG